MGEDKAFSHPRTPSLNWDLERPGFYTTLIHFIVAAIFSFNVATAT